MNLVKFRGNLPLSGAILKPGTPLWQIVPTRDENGRPLLDFMLLIPGLRKQPQHFIDNTLNNIQKVLEQYREVVFVNLNLSINVLWVSIKSRPGIILELVTSIQHLVPEALLVGQRPE
jgi:hypothetical protein